MAWPTKQQRKQKQMKKTMRTIAIILMIILLAGMGVVYCLYPDMVKGWLGLNTVLTDPADASVGETVTLADGDCSVHFLELGNEYAGDCILIKVGTTEVLIDAGSKTNSIDVISAYIDKYVTDKNSNDERILEYVIATHAHEDHIACFGGSTSSSYRTIFDRYDCRTIIDFPLTDSTSKLYGRYIAERDAEVANGAVRYSALECYNNQNGAQRVYDLGSGVTMEILYNYYYDHKASDENDYSVCVMITDGEYKYLLTGDLEGDGEEYLVEYNNLSDVDVFKAGHHGSPSSSTDTLLAVAKPSIVVFTAVMGAYEYTDNIDNVFPSLQACKNVSKYTGNMYVTSYYNEAEDETESYNGNIVIVSNDSGIKVVCSNKADTMVTSSWYQTNRAPKISA